MATRAVHHRDYERVPELLRGFREDAELTQRELADKLKMKQQTVHASETASRRVDIAEFCRWSKACGLDPHDALDAYLKARRS